MGYLATYVVDGVFIGGIYALIALGVVVIYKATKVFNFAVGELVMLGGCIALSLMCVSVVPLWLGIVLSVAVTGVAGMLIYRGIINRFFGKSLLTVVMATCILGYLMSGITMLGWGAKTRSLPQFLPTGEIGLGRGSVSMDLMWSFIIAVVLCGVFIWIFDHTKVGLGMRAIAEDTGLSQSKGVGARRMYELAWIIAGATAAVGSIFLACRTGINTAVPIVGLKAFPVAFIGGLESIPGVVVGGLIIGIIESLSAGYIGSGWATLTPFIFLLVFMIFRPEGIFGLRRVERV